MTTPAEWQGRVGAAWADEWRRTDRAFAAIGAALLDAVDTVAPAAGRALDIGCGAGATTLGLAAFRPGLAITGADLSPDLAAAARERTAHLANVTIVHDDALAAADREAPLDLLVSRHGVMFFDDPAAAFARLRAAAAPGARLVFSCFRAPDENGWLAPIEAAIGRAAPSAGYAPGPFAFADPAFVARLLAGAGWHAAPPVAHDVPYVVGAGDDPAADALGYYRRIGAAAKALAHASPLEHARIEAALAAAIAPYARDGRVTLTAGIWIWSASAGSAS